MLNTRKDISLVFSCLGIKNKHYYDDIKNELKNDHCLCPIINSDHTIRWRRYDTNDELVSECADTEINLSLYPYKERGWLIGNITH